MEKIVDRMIDNEFNDNLAHTYKNRACWLEAWALLVVRVQYGSMPGLHNDVCIIMCSRNAVETTHWQHVSNTWANADWLHLDIDCFHQGMCNRPNSTCRGSQKENITAWTTYDQFSLCCRAQHHKLSKSGLQSEHMRHPWPLTSHRIRNNSPKNLRKGPASDPARFNGLYETWSHRDSWKS